MFELQVNGMTCGGCARRVTAAVQSIDETASVEIDLAGKVIRVRSEENPETVARAVTAAGYPASMRAPA